MTYGITKRAALSSIQKDVQGIAKAYAKGKLSKEELAQAVKRLKQYEQSHPLHINTGLYGHTVNSWNGARENLGRGNYVRGALDAVVRTPLRATLDTAMLPLNWLDRATDSSLNYLHRSSDQLSRLVDDLPSGNVDRSKGDTALRALAELADAATVSRANPTDLYADTKNTVRVMGTNGGSMYAGFGSPEFAAAMLAVNPVVQNAIIDTAMLPVSLPAKLTGLQGTSRDDYEKRIKEDKKNARSQEKSAAYAALMEKRAMSEQAKQGLIGAGLGGLLGGGVGYLTGDKEDPKRGVKGTKLRNTLLGGLIGAAGGGGIGAALGKAEDVDHKSYARANALLKEVNDVDSRSYSRANALLEGVHDMFASQTSINDTVERALSAQARINDDVTSALEAVEKNEQKLANRGLLEQIFG